MKGCEINQRRNSGGATMPELLVAGILMSFVLAIIGEIMVAATLSNTLVNNKTDAINSSRLAVQRLVSDIKASAFIGDYYATKNGSTSDDPLIFPSINNSYSTTPPSGGWPPSPWDSPPYTLNGDTLILQQPVISNTTSGAHTNGIPLKTTSGLPDLDTIVYRVVPATNNTGQFDLQMIRLAGERSQMNSSYRTKIETPQTIVRGIVGPFDPSSGSTKPQIFSYMAKSEDGGVIHIPSSDLSEYSLAGVSMEFEIEKSSGPQSEGHRPQTIPIRSEAFLRNSSIGSIVTPR